MLHAARQAMAEILNEMRAQKLRFFLNVAAFLIASTCLIALAGITESARRLLGSAAEEAMDDDGLEVRPQAAPVAQQHRSQRNLERGDVLALSAAGGLAAGITSSMRETWAPVRYRRRSKVIRLAGAEAAVLQACRLTVARGRFFAPGEVEAAAKVVVIGANLWRDLLERDAAFDQRAIELAGQRFRIVGVLAPKPSFGGEGPWSWDERAIVPWTAFRSSLQDGGSRNQISSIFWHPLAGADVAALGRAARAVVDRVLLWRHLGVQNFRVIDPGDDSRTDLVGSVIAGLLLSTAVVSFVVGGFTITNAALASVAQRRREIGVRRAVGASRGDITLQFFLETVASALVGAGAGMATGIAATWVASLLMRLMIERWTLAVPGWALGGSTLLALAVGAISGVYPAWRAARLDPVLALRGE
jgi:putative ABC transport system permease protein